MKAWGGFRGVMQLAQSPSAGWPCYFIGDLHALSKLHPVLHLARQDLEKSSMCLICLLPLVHLNLDSSMAGDAMRASAVFCCWSVSFESQR